MNMMPLQLADLLYLRLEEITLRPYFTLCLIAVILSAGCQKDSEPGQAKSQAPATMPHPNVSGMPTGSPTVTCTVVKDQQAGIAPAVGSHALGPAVEITGSRQFFKEPVTLEIPIERMPTTDEKKRLYVATQVDGRWIPLAAKPVVVEQDQPVVRVAIRHFSSYQVFMRDHDFGLPQSPALEGANHIVILIHGLDSGPDTWAPMQAVLRAKADPKTEILAFSYQNDQSLNLSASFLAEEIADLRKRNPKARIDFVTHSMGGLIARDYIERLGGDAEVNSLLMIAPPNHGSKLAQSELVGELWEHFVDKGDAMGHGRINFLAFFLDGAGGAAKDLMPGSDFLRGLNPAGWCKPANVEYTIWAGTRPFAEIGGLVGNRLTPELRIGSGDGAVSVESATLPGVEVRTVEEDHLTIQKSADVMLPMMRLLFPDAGLGTGTPSIAWKVDLDEAITGMAARGQSLFLVTPTHLLAFNTKDGSRIWDYTLKEKTFGLLAPPVIVGDTIYTGGNTSIIGVSLQDGQEVFRFNVGNTDEWLCQDGLAKSHLLVIGDQIYFLKQTLRSRDSTYLCCVDIRTKSLTWKYQANSLPLSYSGGVLFLPGNKCLIAVDAKTGRVRWRSDERSYPREQIVCLRSGLIATWENFQLGIYGPYRGRPIIVDSANGERLGAVEGFIADDIGANFNFMVSDGTTVFACKQGKVAGQAICAFSPQTMKVTWETPIGSDLGVCMFIKGDTLFVRYITRNTRREGGIWKGHLLAIKCIDGKVVWDIPIDSAYFTDVYLAVGENTIFCGDDKTVSALQVK